MVVLKATTGISRSELARDCLQQIRLWPGCETIGEVRVLGDLRGGFSAHVIDYGSAPKSLSDRALGCIVREKLRQFHLKTD